jgi:hypothetical protein
MIKAAANQVEIGGVTYSKRTKEQQVFYMEGMDQGDTWARKSGPPIILERAIKNLNEKVKEGKWSAEEIQGQTLGSLIPDSNDNYWEHFAGIDPQYISNPYFIMGFFDAISDVLNEI